MTLARRLGVFLGIALVVARLAPAVILRVILRLGCAGGLVVLVVDVNIVDVRGGDGGGVVSGDVDGR